MTVGIETPRLRLAPLAMSDETWIGKLFGDPEVMRYIGAGRPYSAIETGAYLAAVSGAWRTAGLGVFAVRRKAEGDAIGECGAIVPAGAGAEPCELTYTFAKHVWGYGYAHEALSALIEYATRERRCSAFIAHVDAQNVRSQNLMKRFGFGRGATAARYNRPHIVYSSPQERLEGTGRE